MLVWLLSWFPIRTVVYVMRLQWVQHLRVVRVCVFVSLYHVRGVRTFQVPRLGPGPRVSYAQVRSVA